MDPRETYRQEKAKRGIPLEQAELKELFRERLQLLRRDSPWRDFAKKVGLPHSTIHSWVNKKNKKSDPTRKDLLAIAERAELPGVPCGLLSVDWLCGLSNEPNRNVRVAAEQLPAVLVRYVAEQIADKVGLRGRGELEGMKDGESLLRSIVDRGVGQWRSSAARSRDKLVAGVELLSMMEGKVDPAKFDKLLNRLGGAAPEGDIISWEPAANRRRATKQAAKKTLP